MTSEYDRSTEVVLSKDELPFYKMLCNRFGLDNELYRSSRLLEMTPRHYVQLTVMCSDFNAQDFQASENPMVAQRIGTPDSDFVDGMMFKFAEQMDDEQRAAVDELMNGLGSGEMFRMAEAREFWGVLAEGGHNED